MKEINDFLKRFFRFIFSCHIPERHSCFFFHVHLRIALSNAHHSAALIHALHHICEQPHHEQKRQDHRDKHFKKQLTDRIRNLTLKLNPGTVKFCHKRIIVNISRIKIRRVFFPFFFYGRQLDTQSFHRFFKRTEASFFFRFLNSFFPRFLTGFVR